MPRNSDSVYYRTLTVHYRVSAIDMSKLQPYNLTAALMFVQEDLNQDGQMTKAEIEAVFDKYDTNSTFFSHYTILGCGQFKFYKIFQAHLIILFW